MYISYVLSTVVLNHDTVELQVEHKLLTIWIGERLTSWATTIHITVDELNSGLPTTNPDSGEEFEPGTVRFQI